MQRREAAAVAGGRRGLVREQRADRSLERQRRVDLPGMDQLVQSQQRRPSLLIGCVGKNARRRRDIGWIRSTEPGLVLAQHSLELVGVHARDGAVELHHDRAHTWTAAAASS